MTTMPPDHVPGNTSAAGGSGSKKWLLFGGLGCGGCVILVVAFALVAYMVAKKATAGPELVARAFLDAAAAGDFTGAHEKFSVDLKRVQPFDTFSAEAEANKHLFAVKDTTYTERSVHNATAKLAGTLSRLDGGESPVSFDFIKEKGVWKIQGYSIGTGQ